MEAVLETPTTTEETPTLGTPSPSVEIERDSDPGDVTPGQATADNFGDVLGV